MGWARQFYRPDQYVGVDGTRSPFADVVADLAVRTSSPYGIFCRGVLEHNPQWEQILANLLSSFRWRAFVAVFTPVRTAGAPVEQIGFTDELGVPDLSFTEAALTGPMGSLLVKAESITSVTAFGSERLFFLEKPL